MPTKIEASLSDAQFREFCDRLLALPGSERTLAGIQELATEYGITVSHEGARTFKAGPFARYIERANASREAREALVAAAGAGVHPLDALEEVAVQELQDHLISGETIDLKFVTGQLLKLRTSISMREESHRKQADLERKVRETTARIELAEKQLALRDEQIGKLERERSEWEERRQAIAASADRARAAVASSPDEVRAAAVAEIDRIMGLTK